MKIEPVMFILNPEEIRGGLIPQLLSVDHFQHNFRTKGAAGLRREGVPETEKSPGGKCC